MQHIDVSKKRPARWPWLLGIGLLVLVIWGVTVLLRPDPAPEPPATVPTAADTLPPAMIPSESRGAAPRRDRETPGDDTISANGVGERGWREGEALATAGDVLWIPAGADAV